VNWHTGDTVGLAEDKRLTIHQVSLCSTIIGWTEWSLSASLPLRHPYGYKYPTPLRANLPGKPNSLSAAREFPAFHGVRMFILPLKRVSEKWRQNLQAFSTGHARTWQVSCLTTRYEVYFGNSLKPLKFCWQIHLHWKPLVARIWMRTFPQRLTYLNRYINSTEYKFWSKEPHFVKYITSFIELWKHECGQAGLRVSSYLTCGTNIETTFPKGRKRHFNFHNKRSIGACSEALTEHKTVIQVRTGTGTGTGTRYLYPQGGLQHATGACLHSCMQYEAFLRHAAVDTCSVSCTQ
jgi:hypothetical protein